MKHYTTTQPNRYKHHTCVLLALFLWVLPALASAQELSISPEPTEGFIDITRNGVSFGTCGIGGRPLLCKTSGYPPGSLLTLTATANAPYQFVGWSGDCSGTSASVTVTVNTGTTETCSPHFAKAPYTQVSVSVNHQCAVLSNGSVQCWGLGLSGQLGNGASSSTPTPVTVQGISTAAAVSTGGNHSCALLMDKTVQCWGSNTSGQLGIGSSSGSFNIPQVITGLTNVTAMATGNVHNCAIREDGRVLCWGLDQRSTGILALATGVALTPTISSSLTSVTSISASSRFSCAILRGGTAKCWGEGNKGQLGNGNSNNSNTPVDVVNLDNAIAISVSDTHACAILRGGTAKCWGEGNKGQLGNGNSNNSNTPVDVVNLTNVVAISAANPYTCAVREDGRVLCWGSDSSRGGHLGLGTTTFAPTPTELSGITTAIDVDAGESSDPTTCAILADGNAYCWGEGYGATPTAVLGQPGVLTSSAATAAFHGYAFTAGSPYRAIANTLSGALPSWLKYSPSTGVFFGTPSAGSGSAPNLRVTVSDSALIPFPAIDIPIISQAVSTALTVTRASTRPLNIPADVAVGAPFAVPKFIVKNQNNAEVPVQWSLSNFSSQFTIDPDTGTISLISTLPPTAGQNYGGTVEVRFPSPSQLAIQPSLSSLTPVIGSFVLIVQVVDPSTMTLYIKTFLEGPLQ